MTEMNTNEEIPFRNVPVNSLTEGGHDPNHYPLLFEEMARLSTLMDNLPGMAYRCLNNVGWTMLYVSNGAYDLTGFEAGDFLLGKNIQFGELIHPEDVKLVWDTVQDAITRERPFKIVCRVRHKELGYRWVWEQGQKVGSDDKGMHILEGFITDITEKQTIQEELRYAKEKAEESDRLKSSFLANMSHEIRTPLNAIMGFSNLLSEPDLNQEQRTEYAAIIERSSNQLLSLVNDIIDISLLETGQVRLFPKEISISHFLNEIQKLYQKREILRKDVKIQLELAPCAEGIFFVFDDFRMRQVLMNLMDNAVKFTQSGSVILGCRGVSTEGELVLFVRDTGQGMASDKLPYIFQRFYQIDNEMGRSHGGTGLGLAISKGYIDLMHGRITVESVPGEGTEFVVYIPQPEQMVTLFQLVQDQINTGALQSMAGKTVLLVEDEPHSMLLLESALAHTGLRLLKADSGGAAIEMCQQRPEIALVLMDLKLPGIDGFEATRQILALRPDLPVIAQTAYAMGSDEIAAREAGCIDYITKPLTREVLIKRMMKYL